MNDKILIEKIKSKKELAGLPDSFVSSFIPKNIPEKISERQLNLVVKEIRAKLRKYVGQYTLKNSHRSIAERDSNYNELKNIIESLYPKSILDVGCGLNPLKIAEKKYTYYACDIDGKSIQRVNDFLKEEGIDGKAWVEDIRTATSFPIADICLLLKVVDLLDKRGHKNAEILIKKIPSSNFIISFPTKTLSGKPMNHPQRGWIERLLTRLGFTYTSLITNNEIFYTAIQK